ncbi:SRPBCC family protein [Nocardia stercoris]|uniref:SRPBCC family protein n=1 Tax=Nocardia stercoris TaxID=2483361 RepID=A0A3M2LH18_9NOCA|nr:SRPBCC family protein [Nocardia stercoris]RMI34058.1 SRPBCC family protein [Nocardia stercoris]
MGHIRYASDVGAPVEVAFTYTDNYLFVPDWMFAIAAFEPLGDAGHGPGAVYTATLQAGIWHPTVTCEITEYRNNAVIGYTVRGRRPGKAASARSGRPLATVTLRFDPLGPGSSMLTFEAGYPTRSNRMPAAVTDSIARTAVRRTEQRLRRQIEDFHGTDLVGRIA